MHDGDEGLLLRERAAGSLPPTFRGVRHHRIDTGERNAVAATVFAENDAHPLHRKVGRSRVGLGPELTCDVGSEEVRLLGVSAEVVRVRPEARAHD